MAFNSRIDNVLRRKRRESEVSIREGESEISIREGESEDSTRHIVTALLKNCSYEVTAVPDVLEAWRILEDEKSCIDLVLTEFVMPVHSGTGLLSKIMNLGLQTTNQVAECSIIRILVLPAFILKVFFNLNLFPVPMSFAKLFTHIMNYPKDTL
ncbi:predicted protein [Arabidopsis lyrata subsp. lyrata]|uniref:Predicted protein n=1 Tax=Arabidopsis lyrata subsp. lyrata TaxID=81972 RepID=D7MT66_ARALL|nr:predicted protein [Arabidopsis lyrata subsp. lyrata]